ncbi:MAG: DNA-processing protein DprA [Actinomycetota bacterium]|nr:DNA-processing protein DprA [Actinomycetota bacterium]
MSDCTPPGAVPASAAPGVPDELRLARAYLAGVAEPPAPALVEFVARVGVLEAADRVRRGSVPASVTAVTEARREQRCGVSDLRAAEALGARLVMPEDDEWPSAAFLAFDYCGCEHLAPPLALWVRGPARLCEVVERSVAIVGARAATDYGNHVATDLAHGVARRGCTVISGAAYGIDGAAHRGALAADGVTIAVLACGLDRAYPAGHTRLLARIGEQGLVVSEYSPGTLPARHRFLVRNRIIAGLAAGTVVVEAGWRSGSRRTASDAGLLGRPVMAVPGPVTSAQSVGCHHLLREPGTVPVTRAEEVIEAIGRIGEDLSPPLPGMSGLSPVRATDALSTTALRVHEALPRQGEREPQALSVESGLPVELVRAALPELVRSGLVERSAGGWRRTGGGARGGA